MTGYCPHCGYDLTGLNAHGSCPECGKGFSPSSAIQSGTFGMRYGKAIALGITALCIVLLGGVVAAFVDDKVGAVLLALVIAALPAFGAFVYWWAQRQDEREGTD